MTEQHGPLCCWHEWKNSLGRVAMASACFGWICAAEAQAGTFEKLDHGAIFRSVKEFGATGNGKDDDTASIQAAINYRRGSQANKHPAVVYLPPGTYRVSNTLVLWQGTYLFGEADNPPTLLLPAHTPGFQQPDSPKPLLATASGYAIPAGIPAGSLAWDLPENVQGSVNNNFGNSIRHINLRIEPGNPGAMGIRWQVAQVSVIRHVRIDAGDAAVGIFTDGQTYDLTVVGGKVGAQWNFPGGVATGWRLSGQTEAAIHLDNWWTATFVDLRIENAAAGVMTRSGMGVMVLDSTFRNIRNGHAIGSRPGTEYLLENVRTEGLAEVIAGTLAATNPASNRVISWRSGKRWVDGKWAEGPFAQSVLDRPPLPTQQYPVLRRPVSVRKYGARGDGFADDTAALRQALAKNREVFLPDGIYLVSDTLTLGPDTVLVGETFGTRIFLKAGSPGFGDPSKPKALLATPDNANANTMIASLLVESDENNPGAVLLDWRVGGQAALWDVFFGSAALNGSLYSIELSRSGGGLFSNVAGFAGGGLGATHIYAHSRGPWWCYQFDFEHASQRPYRFEDASNYYLLTTVYEPPGLDAPPVLTLRRCARMRLYGLWLNYWLPPGRHSVEITDCRDVRIYQFMTFNSPAFASIQRTGQTPDVLRTLPPEQWKANQYHFLPELAKRVE